MENPVDAITQQLAVASVRHGGPTEVEVESSNLIRSLFEVSKGDPRLVRSTPHIVNASGKARMIRSWKMNEFKYKVQPCPFPTLARGFFTERVRPYTDESNNEEDGLSSAGSDEQKGFHRVVARGYDKFFNISEVPWTSWESMEVNTAPPYVLTLKSNGCIIFMAAISPQDVLVMSKHSMGAVKDREISHAQMGEIWVEKHLKSKGRTKEELASWLWEKKLTAVAELCDDSFEEHVLPYSQETTGLHLHGLNRNQGNFETLPTEEVDAFAHEFGFIATPTKVLQSIHEVREFMEQIEKAGKWNESAVEGFVVRTKVATPSASRSIRDAAASPPYPPGSDFFFKVKFDEPYMTYRDWREITRSLLAHKKKKDAGEVRIAKSRLRRPESHLYQKWVEKEINRDIKQFDGFAEGKGIIATRERFLKWMDTDEGQAELRKLGKVVETASSSQSKGPKRGEWERVVIVPVAVPGCGKNSEFDVMIV
ncbi:hypothetical protein FRC03_007765 [Tulasnella sp. 419]|nr:hypothetical protein FRC03_007765 [Tulasnella sp. 419]